MFAQSEVNFCGFLVSKKGIRTQPEKISLIKEWPTPRDIYDLKSFLGLCGCYQRYASIVACLTSLYKKHTIWKWTAEEQSAFDKINFPYLNPPWEEISRTLLKV